MPFAPSPTDGSIPTDLVLLAAERAVTVTREEHHQDVLSGRAGRAVVELRPCTIASGKHAGQDGLEVVLDGRRVGELTRLMAQRYRPMVDHLTAGGYRAGCEAFLQDDPRGTQVELRLPAGPTTAALPPAATATVRHRRPVPVAPAPTTVAPHVVPRHRPQASTAAVPHATPQHPYPPIPPASGRRRSRRMLGVAGAAIGILLLASAIGNAARDDQPATLSPLPTAAAATSSPALPATPVTSSPPADESAEAPVVAPAGRSTPQARPPAAATSKPVTRAPATTSKPAPRTVQAAPKPAPKPAVEPDTDPSGCDPNYSGCVPIARDVDCAGGSGDGPAYVKGPVRVIGKDIYGLDKGGEPGVGCE
jgi:hypothetical protein